MSEELNSQHGKIGGVPSAAVLFGAIILLAALLLGARAIQGVGHATPQSSLEVTGQPTTLWVVSPANIRDRATSRNSNVIAQLEAGSEVHGVVEQGEIAGHLWLRLSNGNGFISLVSLSDLPPVGASEVATADSAPLATQSANGTFSDASEYCSVAGTADGPPDSRYVGPDRVAWIERAIGFKEGSGYVKWGCDNGAVVACINYGVTGPCDKVDTDRNPHEGLLQFCREEPNSEIPAAASGHYTAFDWVCRGGKPEIRRQVTVPDHRGYTPGDYTRVTK